MTAKIVPLCNDTQGRNATKRIARRDAPLVVLREPMG
jgi:hypothetical protein